jgi:1-aminocyclopropane-1-carboxylate deaminase/D-cysteine desulfhydrase-like pyridoxal-dependent ACC family enzyme
VLGLETHVVFGGGEPATATGNQLLARLFGARLHFAGGHGHELLRAELARVADELERDGRRVYRIPMGGSTATGEFGFAAAWIELMRQCAAQGIRPRAVVHASATAGTHAGLLVGRAVWQHAGIDAPDVVAFAVDTLRDEGLAEKARRIARECLAELDLAGIIELVDGLVDVDDSQLGAGYAVPTAAGDAAVEWAARKGGWVLDRTYTGKAFAGLLAAAREGRFGPEDTVVFWHTGGQPAVFAPGGSTYATASVAADPVLATAGLTEKGVA